MCVYLSARAWLVSDTCSCVLAVSMCGTHGQSAQTHHIWQFVILAAICPDECLQLFASSSALIPNHYVYNSRSCLSSFSILVHSGDADAEVKRLMAESANLNSAQQEAEAHLSQSKQTIQELQAALKAAQVTGHVCWQRAT